MSRLPMLLGAMGLTIIVVATARATHDTPGKAKSIKADLVRAYAECAAPNDVHDRVTEFASACSPAAPYSSYNFGPAGQGQVEVRLVNGGIRLRFAVRDVRNAADVPADNVVFSGRVHMRLTDNGCSAASSCTVETFISVDLPCAGGRCSAKVLYPDILFVQGLDGAVEITRIDVLDDAGDRFATQGILLH